MIKLLFVLLIFGILIAAQIATYKFVQRLNKILAKDSYGFGLNKPLFNRVNLRTYKALWFLKMDGGKLLPNDKKLRLFRSVHIYGYLVVLILIVIYGISFGIE